ncbi:MAG: hypothetical protein E6Q98_15515 [Rhodospirillaceae bacterium]|nr:MAG: hypothetical protein E6Q98_15515 [Rhodospirillaceae bacterium]
MPISTRHLLTRDQEPAPISWRTIGITATPVVSSSGQSVRPHLAIADDKRFDLAMVIWQMEDVHG